MQNKSLLIPHIESLDSVPLSETVGLLDERGVRCPIDSLNWAKDYPYHPLTIVNCAHSATALYLDFFVRSNYLRAENYENNSPVWDDSSVSVFLQPNDGGEYFNIDINCIGAINAARRVTRRPVTRFNDEEIAQIGVVASCGNRPFREVEGLFTWNLLVKIPFSLLGIEYHGKPVAMKGNFCKCATGTSQPHFLTWNPVESPKPDFHAPEAFGDIILA